MLELIEQLGEEYSDRTYILAETDSMSGQKLKSFEERRNSGNYTVKQIPRSREVGQSYISSIGSTFYALYYAVQVVYDCKPDLVLLNGPGTCIPVAFAAAFFDLIRLTDTVIIYEESICRVTKLSLSGAILYYCGLVDDVLVQWPELKQKYPRCTYIGHLPNPDEEVDAMDLELVDTKKSN
ncbi:unnamed protein product [Caenorhabditis bovis]|uniref:UDP-N-acetylglucosamine transferase subunit ALG14 n=1 Tax=Caenorhabditis bovis TaxID=2654633 RepID=A0A8S1EQY8_9PELO|nr:unnamed protein product [Caenorhabditis bovis]